MNLSVLAEDVNGFEFLCHPNLEKPDTLELYFKNWLKIVLKVIFVLLKTLPMSNKYFNPIDIKEQENSSSLRARYKVSIEMEQSQHKKDKKSNKSTADLKTVSNARHFLGKLKV
jgi:hypothetical protein